MTAEITNNTDYSLHYGMGYTLEKFVDDEWVNVPFVEGGGIFNAMLLSINQGDTKEIKMYATENTFGELEKGSYRFVKVFSVLDEEFEEETSYFKYFEFEV